MQLADFVKRLITNEELATSRIGIACAGDGQAAVAFDRAETIMISAEPLRAPGLACELVVADARQDTVVVLGSAVQHLSRDGILLARVPAESAAAATRQVTDYGCDWASLLPFDDLDRILIAAIDVHPEERGSFVADHLVHPPGPGCVRLPQNGHDRARRRFVRRQGRHRMLALANQLQEIHGSAVHRIVAGIQLLVGERPPKPDRNGRRPGMFTVPDLEAEPWPDPRNWPQLNRLMAACERYGRAVSTELRELVGSNSLAAYLPDDYNMNKFQLRDASDWSALRLIDWRNPRPELPEHCRATRLLLSEVAAHLSGEVNILRVAPRTALPPHYDDYDCEQYVQIGLSIPDGCAIRVGGEARTWEEGRPIVFNPAFLHEVWNHSDKSRDVLAIDLWHAGLSDLETQALHQVRNELERLRLERRQSAGRQ